MRTTLKVISVSVTAASVVGAIAIGGGTPLTPGHIAQATRQAAENSRIAASNTERAARDTRALATIVENVQSQVDASRKLLQTQVGLLNSSRAGAKRSKKISAGVAAIHRALDGISDRLDSLTAFSEQAAGNAQRSSSAGDELATTLRSLRARFDEVMKQSRRLNRKARGYSEVRDGPG